jgi:SAM-dependent methyltransferase
MAALQLVTTPPGPRSFDEAYYRHFYDEGRVHDHVRVGALVSGILGFAAWWEIPVTTVLDVGAGLGFAQTWLTEHRPEIAYVGVDVSEHACELHGHTRADISRWRPQAPSDLVLCISVLQYLSDDEFVSAAANLASATRHLLYLEIPTKWDRANVIDPDGTDLAVHWRTGAWYRRMLNPWFEPVGAGMWRRIGGGVPFFELEAPPPAKR